MDKRQALALLRVGFAILAVVAILVQMLDLAGKGNLNPVSWRTRTSTPPSSGSTLYCIGSSRL